MKTRPSDDSPDPIRSTPKRTADELDSIGLTLARLALRARQLSPWIEQVRLEPLCRRLQEASHHATDLGTGVRVGGIPLLPEHLDRAAGREAMPLLEFADKNRKPLFDRIDGPPLSTHNDKPLIEERLCEIAAKFEPPTDPAQRHDAARDEPYGSPADENTSAADLQKRWERVQEAVPPRNGLVELPAANGGAETPKPRRKPACFSWEVWAIDPKGRAVSLGPMLVPTRDQVRAEELARTPGGSACVGQRFNDLDGVEHVADAENLVVLRTGSPEAVKFASSFASDPVRKCRVCGCTDDDCSQCIEKTGEPCTWIGGPLDGDLCSACACADAEELAPTPASDDPFPLGGATAETDSIGSMWWKCRKCGGDYRLPAPGKAKCHKRHRYNHAEVEAADAKKARKAESDRKYREKKAAKRALEKAVGNRVESPAAPVDRPASVREPVIAGPTKPVERLADPDCASVLAPTPAGYWRVWRVVDGNRTGGKKSSYGTELGEVTAATETEARRAALELAGDRAFEVLPKMVEGGKGQAIVPVETYDVLDLSRRGPDDEFLVLGRVVAPNPARALIMAEKRWPDVPSRNLNMRPASLAPAPGKSRKPKLPPLDPTVAKGIHDEYCPNGAAAAAAPVADDIFIAWSGRNPLYAVRAASLKAATEWVRANHPKDARIDVRADEGVYKARKLMLQVDLKDARSERRWDVYDTRFNPPPFMGEVVGANITRAAMAAEAEWPHCPGRMMKIVEKGTRTAHPANRLQRAEPDRDLAEFRAGFDQGGEEAAAKLERREPDPPAATTRSRRKRSEVGT